MKEIALHLVKIMFYQSIFPPATSCLFNTAYHSHGTSFDADPCSNCTCINGTSICQRVTCPVLECRQEVQVPAMMLGAPGSAGATKLVKFSGMGGGASVLGKVVGGNTGRRKIIYVIVMYV